MQSLSLRENWVGLESNPEVLTEYAHKMGVSKYARPTSPADNRLRCTHSPRTRLRIYLGDARDSQELGL